MKRDWDVIREVLTEVEGLTSADRIRKQYASGDLGDGTADDPKVEHAFMLFDAGLLSGKSSNGNNGRVVFLPELSWEGRDLLDTMRSKPVWDRIKVVAQEKGIELTVDAVKALGKGALDWVLTG